MNFVKKSLGGTLLLAAIAVVVVVTFAVVNTTGQGNDGNASRVKERWEYLAVAGPSTTNLTATGSTTVRKEPNAPFGREGFVLEQHLDKLGAVGWELVTVAGPPTDPVYYFKRKR